MNMGFIVVLVLLIVLAAIVFTNIKIVPQSYAYVLERLGAYHETWQTGLHVAIPFIDHISPIISLKENVLDFKPQPVITKDNVTMQVDTVVYMQITDPKLYVYGVEDPLTAIENLTATTLRNIIGDMELDETLTSRDAINTRIRAVIDEATDPWGIKINRVELKNIIPPKDIQTAMEKQMVAERERREVILKAEGQKKSKILIAEGEKEAMILDAQARKESEILNAEADKEAAMQRAKGEAEALYEIEQARARALERINQAEPGQPALTLEALKALESVAQGQATKIIIPSEIQNLSGLIAGLKESSQA